MSWQAGACSPGLVDLRHVANQEGDKLHYTTVKSIHAHLFAALDGFVANWWLSLTASLPKEISVASAMLGSTGSVLYAECITV